MPKFPRFARKLEGLTGSIFEKFAAKMAAHGDNLVKLHIGDTYLPTEYPLPLAPDVLAQHPDYNRYCNTFGVLPLREALVQKLREDNALEVTPNHILVTCGATNGLSAAVETLVEPEEEVLLLAPFWPLFIGMVRVAGARPVEVPFYTTLYQNPNLDLAAHLERYVTPKTVALYLNTPNNPSGKVLNRRQLEQVAEFARAHKLWVISDEAYDGLTFDGLEHVSIATLPGLFEQTLTMFTFSKSFMFAGLRLGWVVGSEEAIRNLNKIMVHQIYSPSTVAQYLMVEPVRTRAQWLPRVRKHYQELRDLFVDKLQVAFSRPEGTYFIFFPTEKYLNGRTYEELVEACLDLGVSVAPGDSFGRDFKTWLRLCFTGEPPEKLEIGIERLNRVFGSV